MRHPRIAARKLAAKRKVRAPMTNEMKSLLDEFGSVEPASLYVWKAHSHREAGSRELYVAADERKERAISIALYFELLGAGATKASLADRHRLQLDGLLLPR